MRRLVVLATLALSLGLSASASAASPRASCAGLVGSYLAGQPGARALIQQSVFEAAEGYGVPPGAVQSDFSSYHQETAEACLA
jgi:hypothetical protein